MEPGLHSLQSLLVVGEAMGQADMGEQQHLGRLGAEPELDAEPRRLDFSTLPSKPASR